MAMEDQIGAFIELLKGFQSRMDQRHESLMKSLEVIRGKLDISTAATASILVASSDERETKVANSTTSTAAHSAAQDVSLVAPVADLDSSERELDATSGTGFNSVCGGSALAVHFAPASPIPSPASASPQDVDLGFQSGVTELSYTHDPLFSTDGDLCILFDGDDGDVDHLSRLPDSLLRDIVARLPIKDAGRTAVLSRRWSILWRAAPLLVGHADLVVLRLNSMSDDISMGVAATNDSAEQASTPALMPALKYPRSIASTSADSGAAAAMANQWVIDRLSFHSFEWAVPNKLFDRPPARALKFLVRPYDPGAGFVGGARVGVCFDTEEVQLDRGKTIAMGLLRRSARTWPADLRTGIGTMLDVVLVPRSPIGLQQQDCAHLLLANNDPDGCFPASNASWPPESAGTKSWLRRPLCWTTRQCPPSLASAAITARVHTSVRHLSDTVIQLAELQDVTGASPIGNLELLSAMHTKCSMKGHDSNEVTLLSLCSFFMTVVAIEGTLHHKEYRSEWLRILLLSFGSLAMSIPGVFMDWLEQPWPPPMLVEIVGSEVEDSNIKLRPTPWPYFCSSCYLVEVQSKGHWALVGFVSLDFCSSKEKMAWYCCLQFMLVTSSACASSPAMHTDVDLEKIDWGSCCAYLIFNALTSWFPVEVARAGESIAAQLDAACQDSCPWRGNDYADDFHLTTSVLQDQQCCRYAVQLHVDCILTWQMQRNQTKYAKIWGTDELPIPMGDMSYSTSDITGLNIQEAVTTDNPKFGLSKLALLLLFGEHSETSSCQVSVEYILQWPHPTQDECKSADSDNWLVHLLSPAHSNCTRLLVPQPWPPPCVILCWMLCGILDLCKCLEITHIRKEAITQTSQQQGSFAGGETSRLWVSKLLLPGNHDLQLLWDPGGFLHKFQATLSQLWRKLHVQLQQFSDGTLTSNREDQRVISWAGTNTAKSRLKEGSVPHIHAWNDVSLTLTTMTCKCCEIRVDYFITAMDLTLVINVQEPLILQLSAFFLDASFTFDPSEMTRLQLNGEHFRIPLRYIVSSHLHTGSANYSQVPPQINTNYWHGLPLAKDGGYWVSFNIRKEHVPWDPGGLLQKRLGDKPLFKRGRMSGYCRLGPKGQVGWADPIPAHNSQPRERAGILQSQEVISGRGRRRTDQEPGGELTLEASICSRLA